ncbi:hypothetical protein M3Y94_01186800 [Aphelenchoides besseyi]|nr:hypothetical protein M3Y94_01186800 [Aphelenchoides besseyi]KAI6228300.1 hypothetical protein M3Y95_00608000 [Aphelenchoides besseyi]
MFWIDSNAFFRLTMLEETVANLEKCLYTTSLPSATSHRCVVVFDRSHAVTYRHGTAHTLLQKDQVVNLYNVSDSRFMIEVVVIAIAEKYDFVVFKTTKKQFPDFPHASHEMYRGQKYVQLGVDHKRGVFWKDGIISVKRVGFYLGTSHGQPGDSGAGIFDDAGHFLGISVAAKTFAFPNLEMMKIDDIANHHPSTKIVNWDVILAFAGIVDSDDDFKPPETD